MNGLPQTEATVTILDAMAMFSHWHADVPFDGSRKDYALDMKLADAFRAMLFCATPEGRLRWIEREVYNPSNGPLTPYQTELCRWWTDIEAARRIPENDNMKETI